MSARFDWELLKSALPTIVIAPRAIQLDEKNGELDERLTTIPCDTPAKCSVFIHASDLTDQRLEDRKK
jgi:hypothetical protein